MLIIKIIILFLFANISFTLILLNFDIIKYTRDIDNINPSAPNAI